MPEDGVVDAGTTQPHSVAIESSGASEAPVQEPSSDQLGENGRATDKASDGNGQQKPEQKERRYERAKRERAEFRAKQAQLQQERESLAKERAEFEEAKKPKRNYTLDELKGYRRQWQNEGNDELVARADQEIRAMEAEAEAERKARTVEMPPVGTPEHRAQWEQAERELLAGDPDFMRAGTRLDTRLREIMGSRDGQIYRQHPRGIIAAYHRAKMELLEADNSKLKSELQRLTGLTSIDGGAPGRVGSGARVESVNDFARLSTKDMRRHLLGTAQRGSTPWF